MKRSLVLRIATTGVFSALCFVLTSFCEIPYAGGAGYLNFGDIATLFVSMALGPIEGAIVGAIGGSLGDLFLGYAAYAPFSLLAKALMALVTGLLFRIMRKKRIVRFIAPFLGASVMILVYMFSYYLILGKGLYVSSAFDCVQGYLMSVLSIPLYLAIEKSGVLVRFDSRNKTSD